MNIASRPDASFSQPLGQTNVTLAGELLQSVTAVTKTISMTENGGYFYSAAPAKEVARRDAASVLARFAGRIGWRDDELVLDVGCGSGDLTNALILPAVASGVARKAASLGRLQAAKDGGGSCGWLSNSKVFILHVDNN